MTKKIVGTHPGASAVGIGFVAFTDEERTHRGASLHVEEEPTISSQYPQRKSPRAAFHDYSGGDYFITICTRDKNHYFGDISDGKINLTDIGWFASKKLATLHLHHRYLHVPVYTVMPNHVHAIFCIDGDILSPMDASGCFPTRRSALSVAVGGFKQSVSVYARRNNIEFAWQGRYHDHIIRGVHDGNRICDYIENNVARWENDCFYPELSKY